MLGGVAAKKRSAPVVRDEALRSAVPPTLPGVRATCHPVTGMGRPARRRRLGVGGPSSPFFHMPTYFNQFFPDCQGPVRSVILIPGDILQGTVEDAAQLTEGIGAHVAILAQPVQLAGADTVFLNELVLRYALALHGFPQPVKYNQGYHHPAFLPSYRDVLILTIARIRAIICGQDQARINQQAGEKR